MNVLVINCGSSTLKFDLFEMLYTGQDKVRELRIAHGVFDRIGDEGTVSVTIEGNEKYSSKAQADDHDDATQQMLKLLASALDLRQRGIDAVGHRVVHGGDEFIQPALIEDDVLDTIEQVSRLAPLHNGPSLEAIHATRKILGTSVPMVAVFDTAFHRTMPERAARYAIPSELSERHRIWRYGFHGIAHRYMMERYAVIVSKPIEEVKLITLQLGNGCSAAAIQSGHSVDTSMGLTPLEGLMMGTRSGDVDPALVGFLARREGIGMDEAEEWLNRQSGLLGVSGRSQDMRELLEAEIAGDINSALAVDMFCYRARKYVGAYMAALGGADALIFGGGIGENAPVVRERICAGMEWCGLKLDSERNDKTIGIEAIISTDDSVVKAHVVPVDEAILIARDTVRCVQDK